MEAIESTTKDLVEILEDRPGVEVKTIGPYQETDISVNGPAVVLIVYD